MVVVLVVRLETSSRLQVLMAVEVEEAEARQVPVSSTVLLVAEAT
jgi:hypothetical protein